MTRHCTTRHWFGSVHSSFHNTTLYGICYATLRYAMLCYCMQPYAMLCYATVCYAPCFTHHRITARCRCWDPLRSTGSRSNGPFRIGTDRCTAPGSRGLESGTSFGIFVSTFATMIRSVPLHPRRSRRRAAVVGLGLVVVLVPASVFIRFVRRRIVLTTARVGRTPGRLLRGVDIVEN